MQAEIITIGDEILIGQILDSNSKWIAEELNKIGVSIYQITSIQDNKEQIVKALTQAQLMSDIIIITGGLGPTKDDITKHTLTDYFNDYLVVNEEVVENIKAMFAKLNYPFTSLNRDQALVPSKCTPLMNNWGTAPGMWFVNKGKTIISLPGVPNEMKGLMQDSVLPKIVKTFKLPYIIHKTILTYGMGESMLAERIEDWENKLPSNIKLAYLPNYGSVRLRLSAIGENKNQLMKNVEAQVEELNKIIPEIIIGFNDGDTIEVVLGGLLRSRKQTLATAESCTGGNIAKLLTAIPGASNYFVGSIVAYNVNIKVSELNVDSDLIEKHSVVSGEVAEAMAKGIQNRFNTDYAIATTGNAGPTTDLTDKTEGVVFIAIATPVRVFSEEFFFGKPREKVIDRASTKALEMLRKEILKN